jgi:dTDP-4-amino-4,6-dideoxygalactose transaminase
MKPLFVTKTYLPAKKKFLRYIDDIWESHTLTNNGPLLLSLEERLREYSGCSNVLACTNGTVVLQLALKALGITKEVITTPFTYVATTNAILWEGCQPVFVDIAPCGFTIDTAKIEAALTENTEAILATHVYGYPCDVEAIEKIARKHNLKVIYDAAHAFGTRYKGKSIFTFGDISTCSFHATKLFHSGEGGALFINNEAFYQPSFLYRSFGHIYDDYYSVGINAKMSELHAAMGLCVLDDLPKIHAKREKISAWYDKYINKELIYVNPNASVTAYNCGYYPVLFQSEDILLLVLNRLAEAGVFPRRYFYPSLNTLPFLERAHHCPVSEDISKRVLCLPLSYYVKKVEVIKICSIINSIITLS